jgi:hypothetical protein
MSDAAEQATKKRRNINRTTRPHFALLDSLIGGDNSNSKMIGFLSVHLGLLAYRMYANKEYSDIEKLKAHFPNAFKRCWNLYLLLKNGLLCKLYAILFKYLYKIRCHLIIWRKHA